MISLPLDWMVSSLLAAAAEAEAAVLEAVEAEVLEEQPASERTPAAAMTLMREIKVLRFIGDDPFLFSMGNFLKELTGPCLFGMGEELLRGGFLDHDAVFHEDGADETLRAKPISWVTTSMVMPSCASCRMTASTSPVNSGSRALVGSSK